MTPGQLARTPVYRQIADFYVSQIRDGTLKPGDQLPTVDELRRTWEVAWATAARVTATLRGEGLVRSSQAGAFVIGQ